VSGLKRRILDICAGKKSKLKGDYFYQENCFIGEWVGSVQVV
jgi:hypothetical protein